jgi:hypothetical protein
MKILNAKITTIASIMDAYKQFFTKIQDKNDEKETKPLAV